MSESRERGRLPAGAVGAGGLALAVALGLVGAASWPAAPARAQAPGPESFAKTPETPQELWDAADYLVRTGQARQALPYLRQFVVTEDAVANGAGAATLQVWPHIVVPGTGGAEADTNTAFATVSAAPADDALLTFFAPANTVVPTRAAWNKQAIQLVSARLETPMSDTSSFATDPETGISIRYWRGSDIATGRHIHRWDMIYGAKVVDPRLGARYSGDPEA